MTAFLKKTAGNATIALIVSAFALVGTIAGPVWYLSQYKESVAIIDNTQDLKLNQLDKEYEELGQDVKEVRAGVNALLIERGINPSTVAVNAAKK